MRANDAQHRHDLRNQLISLDAAVALACLRIFAGAVRETRLHPDARNRIARSLAMLSTVYACGEASGDIREIEHAELIGGSFEDGGHGWARAATASSALPSARTT